MKSDQTFSVSVSDEGDGFEFEGGLLKYRKSNCKGIQCNTWQMEPPHRLHFVLEEKETLLN